MPDFRDSFTAREVCEGMLSQINVSCCVKESRTWTLTWTVSGLRLSLSLSISVSFHSFFPIVESDLHISCGQSVISLGNINWVSLGFTAVSIIMDRMCLSMPDTLFSDILVPLLSLSLSLSLSLCLSHSFALFLCPVCWLWQPWPLGTWGCKCGKFLGFTVFPRLTPLGSYFFNTIFWGGVIFSMSSFDFWGNEIHLKPFAKVSFLRQKMRPIVGMMSSTGSYSREGVIFCEACAKRGGGGLCTYQLHAPPPPPPPPPEMWGFDQGGGQMYPKSPLGDTRNGQTAPPCTRGDHSADWRRSMCPTPITHLVVKFPTTRAKRSGQIPRGLGGGGGGGGLAIDRCINREELFKGGVIQRNTFFFSLDCGRMYTGLLSTYLCLFLPLPFFSFFFRSCSIFSFVEFAPPHDVDRCCWQTKSIDHVQPCQTLGLADCPSMQ